MGVSRGKSLINIYKECIFHCHVWLPGDIWAQLLPFGNLCNLYGNSPLGFGHDLEITNSFRTAGIDSGVEHPTDKWKVNQHSHTNHGKTIGKLWLNGILWDLPSVEQTCSDGSWNEIGNFNLQAPCWILKSFVKSACVCPEPCNVCSIQPRVGKVASIHIIKCSRYCVHSQQTVSVHKYLYNICAY